MALLKGFPIISLFFARDGHEQNAKGPATGAQQPVQTATEEMSSSLQVAVPVIPIEEYMTVLWNLVNQERGVSNAKVRCTVDGNGEVYLSIGIRPTETKRSATSKKFMRRVRNNVSLGTNIPKNRIDVRHNLKIPSRPNSAQGVSLP